MRIGQPKFRKIRHNSGQTLAARHKSQAKYEATPEQKKIRAERNAARAKMIKKGLVRKGDGQDVDHIRGTGLGNSDDNLRVLTASKNRRYNRRSTRTKLSQ